MPSEHLETLEHSVRQSHTGEIDFAALVPRLLDLGVESYRVDYRRGETTYHFADGAVHVLPSHAADAKIPPRLDLEAVRAAIAGAQRHELLYPEFVRRTLAAGCVGYDAWLTGRRVVYHGRDGDRWTEWFPDPTPPRPAVAVVQRVYDAFARRDPAAVFALFAADAEVVQSPEVPWGGHYRGHAEIAGFFARLTAALDSTLALERFIDAGDRVVALGRTRGLTRAGARRYDVPIAHTWTIRDGLVARAEFNIDNPTMLAALV